MYMFDTNTVSHLFRQHPQVLNVMQKLPPSAVCISSVTEAELLYGVAKRRNKALQSMVEAFLAAVTVYDGIARPPVATVKCGQTWRERTKSWARWIN